MRARQLKPGFFKNEDLAECSYPARIVFAGLWTMADRAGRLEDRPKRIKAELLPFDDEPIGPILAELEKWGFIKRYEVDGVRLLWIPKFLAHQNPHKAEKQSEFPAHPDDHSGSASDQGQNEHSASTVQAQCKDGSRRASSPIPSSPIPDCSKNTPLTLDQEPPAGARVNIMGEESGGGGEEEDNQIPYEAQPYAVSLDIQQIGEGYPEHRYDPGAADNELKIVASKRQWPGLNRVQDDIARRCKCDDWTREDGRFVPMLSRYIRDRMWLMKIPEARAAPQPGYASPESQAIDDIAARLRKNKEQSHGEFLPGVMQDLPEGHPKERPGSLGPTGSSLPQVKANHRSGPPGR